MTPEDFLSEHAGHFTWSAPDGVPAALGLKPVAAFTGRGNHALEVALATVSRRPRADELRRAWAARYGRAPNPLLLVGAYQDDGRWKASICGPAGDDPPVESGLELGEVERIAAAALAEPSRHAAIRFVASIWSELENELPGLRNQGMFATHELRDGVPTRPDWQEACARAHALLGCRGRDLVERLGFSIQTHATAASVLSIAGTKRAIAVFLDEGEDFDSSADRFAGSSPISHALALADREGLPWVVLTRGRQIRVYAARADTGVGRKGRSETFVEANLALLPDHRAGYLPLLFSAAALKDGGTFDEVLEGSRDYSADLGARLRERVYAGAVPSLAIAIASRHPGELDEDALRHVYEQALTVLFRLLFVAYAEDKDLLPYRSNGAYREHALKTLARELADRRAHGPLQFDEHSTDLWDGVAALWLGVDRGNVERGVPAYNGGLFSSDAEVNAAGAALANVRLTNAEFGPALVALLVDEAEEDLVGPVDFRSLSVREFGTIYEGLLESSLSLAPTDLTLDTRKTYVPGGAGDEVFVQEGEVYFHDRSGARKATGSYFTKPFAVEHLLDHALEPALDDHVARLDALLAAGEEAQAAEAFFDFRCVDLAMGSGHFLVAAVDRIEARLSAFLALHPIPQITAELDRLRKAALEALGTLGEGVEIEYASLLRRQVARRCIYGVDANPIAVELARLGIWIHTFVPGLPLSFLDHTLVCGDSLTGIGTLDEAIHALDPEHVSGQASLFREQVLAVLGRAESALQRLAHISEASKAEIEAAREAQHESEEAIAPAHDLFDLIIAARLEQASPLHSFREEELAANSDLPGARALTEELSALHFPIAFPEVFLGDRPGFDCILGNPPWEEIMVDENAFWSTHFPGFRGRRPAEQRRAIEEFKSSRPDLVSAFERATRDAALVRRLVSAGQYPGISEGNADLYKCFAWRFWQLVREGGRVGVVLPRGAISGSGLASWRRAVLDHGSFEDVTTLLNRREWVFDDVHEQYVVALTTFVKTAAPSLVVSLRGPAQSMDAYREARPFGLPVDVLGRISESLSFPQVQTHRDWRVFLKMGNCPPFAATELWDTRPVQGDFNATTDRRLVIEPMREGAWPSYKGASIDLWNPDTGTHFGSSDPGLVRRELFERRLRQARRRGSVYAEISKEALNLPDTLPIEHPRLAFRDITNRLNERTAIAVLVPPRVVLTNSVPFLVFVEGGEREEAFLLGMMCSIPFDWYARRIVERHLNFFLLRSIPVPRVPRENHLRRRVEEVAGRLAAVDERFTDWADAVGVPIGGVTDEGERADLVAELDAASSLLYGLDEDDVRVIFETFHEGWDHGPRLRAVLDHYRRLT